MDTVLSMSDIHPRDRVAYWHDVASKAFVDHEGTVKSPSTFNATVRQAQLGELTLVEVESVGLETVQRTARNIAHGVDNVFLLCMQLEGSSRMCQDGREALIHPGDFTLLDAQRPYLCKYDHRKQITIKIPHRALKARLISSAEMSARAVSGRAGTAEFLFAYVKMVHERISALQALQTQIAEHILDLTALALTTESGSDTPALSSGRAAALLQLRMAIESRLTDPRLDPTAAADAAGISVRYANDLLSQQGTSLERYIVSRRLERCRSAFEDPGQAHRTVSEIVYAWGFSDVSHFNRRFKAAYGSSPRNYRRQFSN